MMTNLFSIFDPSTPNLLSSNWLSMTTVLFFLPLMIWLSQSRLTILLSKLTSSLFMDMSPLIKKSTFTLIMSITFFMFIMINNLMGLLPYIFTSTAHLTLAISMALPAWLALMMYGWSVNYSNLLAHLVPQGTPTMLMPFMVVIETISSLIRPLTLAVRLTANMIAGHLLIVLLSSTTQLTPIMALPVLVSSQMALTLLELAVSVIQAYVFSVLITLYAAELTE